jgi:hypothetical protein
LKVNLKNNRPAINLIDADKEDINDVLLKIQTSFNITLVNEELKEVKTFGSLCDTVVKKVKHKNASSCTTQQAFYKLRNAINSIIAADKELIKPQTRLSDIFPRDTRLQVIAEIEKEMGFKLNLLKPRGVVVFAFSSILTASVICLFFYPAVIGCSGLILSVLGLLLAGKFGKEMDIKTLGDLAEKIAREHYLTCRRNASTVNRNEIAAKIKELFTADLYLEPSGLTRDSRFN